MSDMKILKNLISAEAQIRSSIEYGNTVVQLQEPQEGSSSIKILRLPSDAFIIKADCFPSPGCVFSGSKGECKRADFIVISESERHILYIELKRTSCKSHHIVQQLKGAKCFIEYCRAVVEWFWDDCKFLKDYNERYVCFCHTGSRKRPTKVRSSGSYHDRPENPQRIDWPPSTGVPFNKLIGKFA